MNKKRASAFAIIFIILTGIVLFFEQYKNSDITNILIKPNISEVSSSSGDIISNQIFKVLNSNQNPISIKKSIYRIEDNLTIKENKTVILSSGVKFLFSENSRLIINGTLIVEGKVDDPVIFGPIHKSWKGIIASGSLQTKIDINGSSINDLKNKIQHNKQKISSLKSPQLNFNHLEILGISHAENQNSDSLKKKTGSAITLKNTNFIFNSIKFGNINYSNAIKIESSQGIINNSEIQSNNGHEIIRVSNSIVGINNSIIQPDNSIKIIKEGPEGLQVTSSLIVLENNRIDSLQDHINLDNSIGLFKKNIFSGPTSDQQFYDAINSSTIISIKNSFSNTLSNRLFDLYKSKLYSISDIFSNKRGVISSSNDAHSYLYNLDSSIKFSLLDFFSIRDCILLDSCKNDSAFKKTVYNFLIQHIPESKKYKLETLLDFGGEFKHILKTKAPQTSWFKKYKKMYHKNSSININPNFDTKDFNEL